METSIFEFGVGASVILNKGVYLHYIQVCSLADKELSHRDENCNENGFL